jgi:hypothetical protein
MVAAFAAYLVASLAHDEVVTWVVVAVSVAAVLVWSRRRGSGGRLRGQRGARCAEQSDSSALRATPGSLMRRPGDHSSILFLPRRESDDHHNESRRGGVLDLE